MKQIISQEEVVEFFKTEYAKNNYDASMASKSFVKKFNLEPNDLTQFEDVVLRLSMSKYFPELNIKDRIKHFIELNQFILTIKKLLGYVVPVHLEPGQPILKRLVDPPSEALEYIGHNKMDISESKVGKALTYH